MLLFHYKNSVYNFFFNFNPMDEFSLMMINVFLFFPFIFRVLLRVRMLYYLKQEVIGNECQKVFDGVDAR